MSRLLPLLLFSCFCVTLADSLKGLYFRNEVQNMFEVKKYWNHEKYHDTYHFLL